MNFEFLPWKDPSRVNREDYSENIEDEALIGLLESCVGEKIFEPAQAYMMGPAGFIPAAPQNSASELYKLFVMHSDGYISPSVATKIEQVPGVEVLHVWTPYRAWLGVGRMFDAEKVFRDIRRVNSHNLQNLDNLDKFEEKCDG